MLVYCVLTKDTPRDTKILRNQKWVTESVSGLEVVSKYGEDDTILDFAESLGIERGSIALVRVKYRAVQEVNDKNFNGVIKLKPGFKATIIEQLPIKALRENRVQLLPMELIRRMNRCELISNILTMGGSLFGAAYFLLLRFNMIRPTGSRLGALTLLMFSLALFFVVCGLFFAGNFELAVQDINRAKWFNCRGLDKFFAEEDAKEEAKEE